MASKRQIEANRKNAKKSTGPRTAEGRLASSHNAVRHGLTATQLVVSVEEEAEFQEILLAFQAELQPAGILQQALFDQIVAAHWRLRRLREIETGYFELRLTQHASQLEDDFPHLQGAAKLAVAVQNDAAGSNAFANLSRYESRIERSFYRALRELQRLQAARAAQPITPSATTAGPPAAPPNSVLPNEPNFAPAPTSDLGPVPVSDRVNHGNRSLKQRRVHVHRSKASPYPLLPAGRRVIKVQRSRLLGWSTNAVHGSAAHR